MLVDTSKQCMVFAALIFHILTLKFGVNAGTMVEDLKSLENGNAKVLLGAFVGEISAIRTGLLEGGGVSAVMDPFMGEAVLKLGKVFVDFPLAPAVHIAFHQGDKKHLEAASFLMNRGANINSFQIERNRSVKYSANYPPSILYALGMGKPPRNSHAAFLQRLYRSLPRHFNFDAVEEWRMQTGNPPLIHIAVLANFFDGVYVIVNDFKMDINATDQNNLTALHIAAWKDDHYLCRFLLQNGANVMIKDTYGRTAFHYAAMRGNIEFMSNLLDSLRYQNKTAEEHSYLKYQVLFAVDNENKTALDLSSVYPPLSSSVQYIQYELNVIHTQQEIISRKSPLVIAGRTLESSVPDPQPGDLSTTRGGWDYFSMEEPSDPCECDSSADCITVDIVIPARLTESSFRNDYYSVQRPVVITDHLAARQGIWAYWQRDEFLHRYGGMMVTSGEKNHALPGAWSLPNPVEMSVRDWVGVYMGANSSNRGQNRSICQELDREDEESSGISGGISVLSGDGVREVELGLEGDHVEGVGLGGSTSNTLPPPSLPSLQSSPPLNGLNGSISACYNLHSTPSSPWIAINSKASLYPTFNTDFKRPPLFNLCGGEDTDNEPYRLHIGPKGSGIPMTAHSAHWDLLVTGVKRWFFVPPGSGIEPRGRPKVRPEGQNAVGDHKVRSVNEWIKDVYPGLLRDKLVSSVIQYPGDVVFVPHDWSYATLFDADSISVSQEFCTLHNTDQRFQPLGFIAYGGNDTHRGIGRRKY